MFNKMKFNYLHFILLALLFLVLTQRNEGKRNRRKKKKKSGFSKLLKTAKSIAKISSKAKEEILKPYKVHDPKVQSCDFMLKELPPKKPSKKELKKKSKQEKKRISKEYDAAYKSAQNDNEVIMNKYITKMEVLRDAGHVEWYNRQDKELDGKRRDGRYCNKQLGTKSKKKTAKGWLKRKGKGIKSIFV